MHGFADTTYLSLVSTPDGTLVALFRAGQCTALKFCKSISEGIVNCSR
jgi:hypothetical protein